MKRSIILFFIVSIFISKNSFSQASWNNVVRFRLFDNNGNLVTIDSFKNNYQISGTYGNKINLLDTTSNERYQYIQYDLLENYVYLKLTTIGTFFSFTLYNGLDTMNICITRSQNYRQANKKMCYHYSWKNLTMKNGCYYFNSDCVSRIVKSNQKVGFGDYEYCEIDKINWVKQAKAFQRQNLKYSRFFKTR